MMLILQPIQLWLSKKPNFWLWINNLKNLGEINLHVYQEHHFFGSCANEMNVNTIDYNSLLGDVGCQSQLSWGGEMPKLIRNENIEDN